MNSDILVTKITANKGGYVKPNTHRRRRRDSTVELSRVGGVY